MDTLTPQQQHILALLKEHDVFRLAVQNAFNQIIITDPAGTILYANQATERITGYAQSEIIGRTPKLWGGKMEPEYFTNMWKVIKEEGRPFIGTITNQHKNGMSYESRIIISPIFDEENNLIGFIGTEDIIKTK